MKLLLISCATIVFVIVAAGNIFLTTLMAGIFGGGSEPPGFGDIIMLSFLNPITLSIWVVIIMGALGILRIITRIY